ncbi:MAG: GerMN domain-containing protein [Spirochaetales bacterium]|nr:GerMN domain-containing protein [Spirochaetales bacterium]
MNIPRFFRERSLEAYLWPSILAAVIIVSLVFTVYKSDKYEKKVFFFPALHSRSLQGEQRFLPAANDPEKSIHEYVKGLLLGPADISLDMLFPEGSRINSLLHREKTLYVDMNSEVLKESPNSLSLEEQFAALTKGLEYNYRSIEKIIFSIEGRPIEFSRVSAVDER